MEVDGNCGRGCNRDQFILVCSVGMEPKGAGADGSGLFPRHCLRSRRRIPCNEHGAYSKGISTTDNSEIIDPEPGRLVIDTREHFLYLTRADGTAIRYAVGVGREGFQWFGSAKVMRKGVWPTWTPPTEMVKRNPDISPATMKG